MIERSRRTCPSLWRRLSLRGASLGPWRCVRERNVHDKGGGEAAPAGTGRDVAQRNGLDPL
ncbi:MAG: hypothetical protein M3275_12225 [Thermoproteota archaeon]|nr:hypothetical protein [Thermoproteota archaeon]